MNLRIIMVLLLVFSCGKLFSQEKTEKNIEKGSNQLVRIAEIEVLPEYWEEYKEILLQGARESVEKEEGVVSIFPMEMDSGSYKIRILEIYKSKEAYDQHIQSKHFQFYKTTTLKMIKDLKLVDMKSLDLDLQKKIFIKENGDSLNGQ